VETNTEQRVAILEAQQKTLQEWLERVEAKLDKSMDERIEKLGRLSENIVRLEQQRQSQSTALGRCFSENEANTKRIAETQDALRQAIEKLDQKINDEAEKRNTSIEKLDQKIDAEAEKRETFNKKVNEKFNIGRGIWIAVTLFSIVFGGAMGTAMLWGAKKVVDLHYQSEHFTQIEQQLREKKLIK